MAKPTAEQIAVWKENRRKWVEALRSGQFEQGEEFLLRNGKYCCLGVLCTIAGISPDIDGRTIAEFGGRDTTAPAAARNFVGLRDDEGTFAPHEGKIRYLTALNDNGTPFSKIADIIESEPPGLFLESVED